MPGAVTTSTFTLSQPPRQRRDQIWDLKTYKIKSDLPGHTDEVYCVDFVADKLVSGGRDRTVKMCVLVRSLSLLFSLFKDCGDRLLICRMSVLLQMEELKYWTLTASCERSLEDVWLIGGALA